MKILNKESKEIIEVSDKETISRFLSFPDKFEKVQTKSKEDEKIEEDEKKEKSEK